MSNSFILPLTAARQAPLSMLFPMQEQWSGLLFPSLGIEPVCLLHWQVDSLPLTHQGSQRVKDDAINLVFHHVLLTAYLFLYVAPSSALC